MSAARFIIYCSGGAGRVRGFYHNRKNRRLLPVAVVYDGLDEAVCQELIEIVGQSKLLLFRAKTKDRFEFSDWLLEVMVKMSGQYLLCFGNRILRGELLSVFRNKLINFHPSLLPAFPGLNAIDQARLAGVVLLGNTAHLIDEGVDTGHVIAQSVIRSSSFSKYEDVLELQFPLIKYVLSVQCGFEIPKEEIIDDIQSDGNRVFFSFE